MRVTVQDIYEAVREEGIDFQWEAGTEGLHNVIISLEINRPGLALAGFFENFANTRLQIFGKGENAYLQSIPEESLRTVLEKFFSYSINCVIFTHGMRPPDRFLEAAEKYKVATFTTKDTTSHFIRIISNILEEKFAPSITMHGVLIEVFGVGVILKGKSGIGKSETALELVERGHRLVTDDLIFIKKIQNHNLIGYGSDVIKYHMEIRGLGIINIKDIFGAGAVRNSKQIDMMITMEEWIKEKEYERLGLDEKTTDILGEAVTHLVVPIGPGRNLPIIIETAAMNHRLKKMGYNPARELNEKLQERIQSGKKNLFSD